MLDELDDLKRTILSMGDGVSLAALLGEAEGKTLDQLALRSHELARELAELNEQVRGAADLAGVSHQLPGSRPRGECFGSRG